MEEPEQPKQTSKSIIGLSMVYFALSTIFGIITMAGAAKLSYDRYGSIFWAIIAFIFAPIYYVYYAFFVSSRAPSGILGGRRR